MGGLKISFFMVLHFGVVATVFMASTKLVYRSEASASPNLVYRNEASASTDLVYSSETSEKKDVSQALCALGPSEGSYLAELESIGSVRVNLICAANGASVATLESLETETLMYSMLYSAETESEMQFLSFDPSREVGLYQQRSNLGIRLKLNRSALGNERLEGTFRLSNAPKPLRLAHIRKTSFPTLEKTSFPKLDQSSIRKMSTLDSGFDPEGKFNFVLDGQRGSIEFENIGNVVRILFRLGDTAKALDMLDGLPVTSLPLFVNTAGIGRAERARNALFHIRGQFTDANRIEFYIVDMKQGLRGPLTATRM